MKLDKHVVLVVKLAAGIALMTMLTGCATRALWDSKLHRPASIPTLSLSRQSEDVLVHYDEACSGIFHTSTNPAACQIQARSYWLFASTNTARGHPPEFVVVTNSS